MIDWPDAELSAPRLLSSARRKLALARTAQVSLLLVVGLGVAAGTVLGSDSLVWGAIVLTAVWIFLVLRSVRLLHQVREGWAALQAGHPDLAQAQAQAVIASHTLLRPATVSALLILAAAWKETRPAQAAQLAGFVLTRRERLLVGDRTGVRVLLVESLLAIGEVEAARGAMLPLYATRLSLADSLRLLLLQLRTEARLGVYRSMLVRLGAKVDMADLMPPRDGALVLALLWLAATQSGLTEWSAWLRRRVSLLANWSDLSSFEALLETASSDRDS